MRFVCSAILILGLAAVARGADKSDGGFAVAVGFGNPYGGEAGCAVEYQVLLASQFRLTPFAAAGAVNGLFEDSLAIGYNAGVSFEYGRWNRAVASVCFGSLYQDRDSLPKAQTRTMIGPSLFLGSKGVARFGLLWQLWLGCTYIFNPINNPNRTDSDFNQVMGLGLGYKF